MIDIYPYGILKSGINKGTFCRELPILDDIENLIYDFDLKFSKKDDEISLLKYDSKKGYSIISSFRSQVIPLGIITNKDKFLDEALNHYFNTHLLNLNMTEKKLEQQIQKLELFFIGNYDDIFFSHYGVYPRVNRELNQSYVFA